MKHQLTVPRRVLTALPAVVLGITTVAARRFLTVAAATLTAATTALGSVLCVPVLNKNNVLL